MNTSGKKWQVEPRRTRRSDLLVRLVYKKVGTSLEGQSAFASILLVITKSRGCVKDILLMSLGIRDLRTDALIL